jgi:cytochrome c553
MFFMISTAIRTSISILIGALFSLPMVHAEHLIPETISVELQFKPDVINGQRVYAVCASCHLPDGWGNRDGVYPQLAGQHATVLMKQLLDIREGRRDSPSMFRFVQERTVGGYQNLADVVAYISTLPMSPNHGKGKWAKSSEEYKQGKSTFTVKCLTCHGDAAQGNSDAVIPRLQGQHYAYLVQQARAIVNHQRKADPVMASVISSLDFDEIDKVMNYISRIRVPGSDLEAREITQ